MKGHLVLIFLFSFIVGCSSSAENPKSNLVKAAKINAELGIDYMRENKMDVAKSRILLALKLDPNSAYANGAMGYYQEKTGDLSLAEQYYQKSIEQSNRSGYSLNNYATFLCRNKRYQEAIPYFDEAANQIGYINTAEALENKGVCANRMGDYSLAYHTFEHAYHIDASNDSLLFEMSEALYHLDKFDDAQVTLAKYVELHLKDKQALSFGLALASKMHDKKLHQFYTYLMDQVT